MTQIYNNTPMEKLEIVCFESEAFYKLLKQVLLGFKAKEPPTGNK